MAENAEILERLDLMQATLRLAFEPQIDAARTKLRADDVSAAILDLSGDWIASTELQEKAAKKTGKTARRVRDRLPELVEQRVLQVRGSERRMEYRKTGLI